LSELAELPADEAREFLSDLGMVDISQHFAPYITFSDSTYSPPVEGNATWTIVPATRRPRLRGDPQRFRGFIAAQTMR
jgi:hypothetical protein